MPDFLDKFIFYMGGYRNRKRQGQYIAEAEGKAI